MITVGWQSPALGRPLPSGLLTAYYEEWNNNYAGGYHLRYTTKTTKPVSDAILPPPVARSLLLLR